MTYPRIDLGLLERESARLQESVERLDDQAVAEPSGCTGWSRGHVLSHLARHAEPSAGCWLLPRTCRRRRSRRGR